MVMERQRLDKIIASGGRWSRREVKLLVRQGRVLVDGVPARSAEDKADPETAEIVVDASCTAGPDPALHAKGLDLMETLQITVLNR